MLHDDDGAWRELDYSRHILPNIDWDSIDAPDPGASQAEAPASQSAMVDIGDTPLTVYADRKLDIDKTPKLSWFARRLADIVPNPWQAARIAQRTMERLREAGATDEAIHDRRPWLMHVLRNHVTREIETRAERVFREKIRGKEIRFDLRAGRPNFRMVESYEISVPEEAGILARADGRAVQLSLFGPVHALQFDSALERDFARYLDEQKALQWWHRVAARQTGDYYLKGWKRDRIWPDFIALGGSAGRGKRLLVFETKGRHLDNPETAYRKHVFEVLENTLDCGTMTVTDGPAKGVFRLVFDEAEFPAAPAEPKESRS